MKSDVQKMIQDINKFADSKLNETNGMKHRAVKVAFQLTILAALMFFVGAEINLYIN
jgi:hypothetical protein